jgi:hypothetical protein
LSSFEECRQEHRGWGEDAADYVRPANARLPEYNVFVRSTNDSRALSRPAQILTGYLAGYTPEDPLAGLDGIADGELPEREDADD